MLLEHHADVNAQGGQYGSALRTALSGGHETILKIFLERGASWESIRIGRTIVRRRYKP